MAETEKDNFVTEKDTFVTLINREGEEESCWDFSNHINNLLKMGWSRPEVKPEQKNNKKETE